jgi:glycosyltransferase involved in cell wall biosynthesis
MSISVIIPCYNGKRWIRSAVESCLHQKFLKEIIIVDDQSDDGSWEILEEVQQANSDMIKIYRNLLKGGNNARNLGFEKSTAKYIQWLDSDDRLLPGKFENQIEPLQNGEADIVYSDWRIDYWDNGGRTNAEQKRYEDYPDFLEELIKDNWTSPNNYLMTRAMAQKLSGGIGWNPTTKVGQDREYFTMAGILGARFKYVPGSFAVYNKQTSGTISGLNFKRRLELNQTLEERFRYELERQTNIPLSKKKRYYAILDTHKLKACFYHPIIKLTRPINLCEIRWDLMHWKMRIVMPWVWLKKHIQYYLKNSNEIT